MGTSTGGAAIITGTPGCGKTTALSTVAGYLRRVWKESDERKKIVYINAEQIVQDSLACSTCGLHARTWICWNSLRKGCCPGSEHTIELYFIVDDANAVDNADADRPSVEDRTRARKFVKRLEARNILIYCCSMEEGACTRQGTDSEEGLLQGRRWSWRGGDAILEYYMLDQNQAFLKEVYVNESAETPFAEVRSLAGFPGWSLSMVPLRSLATFRSGMTRYIGKTWRTGEWEEFGSFCWPGKTPSARCTGFKLLLPGQGNEGWEVLNG